MPRGSRHRRLIAGDLVAKVKDEHEEQHGGSADQDVGDGVGESVLAEAGDRVIDRDHADRGQLAIVNEAIEIDPEAPWLDQAMEDCDHILALPNVDDAYPFVDPSDSILQGTLREKLRKPPEDFPPVTSPGMDGP